MSEERVMLGEDEVDGKLTPGKEVHTFKQAAGGVLLGCCVLRSKLLAMAKKNGAELAGERAEAMKHGVVIWDDDGTPVFCATV